MSCSEKVEFAYHALVESGIHVGYVCFFHNYKAVLYWCFTRVVLG